MDFVTHFPRGVGNSRPAHKVSTFPGYADDLHTEEFLQAIHMIDCLVAWSTSIYCIR